MLLLVWYIFAIPPSLQVLLRQWANAFSFIHLSTKCYIVLLSQNASEHVTNKLALFTYY